MKLRKDNEVDLWIGCPHCNLGLYGFARSVRDFIEQNGGFMRCEYCGKMIRLSKRNVLEIRIGRAMTERDILL